MAEQEHLFAPYHPKGSSKNGPVKAVQPLENGVLRVTMETGSVVDVPLREHFEESRLCPLREKTVWNNVDTDGCFIRWRRDGVEAVELSWDELMRMTLGRHWY